MRTQTDRSTSFNSSLWCKIIPAIEHPVHFAHVFESSRVSTILLRHCNIFEFDTLLERAARRNWRVYVNVDQISGIYPDAAGLSYLVEHLHVSGIVSNHARVLATGKAAGLKTIQRIFAVDSTGLEMSLESVDSQHVDLLDISPALVIPYVKIRHPLPFIASGLIYSHQQVQAVLRAGAQGVVVGLPELWP